MIISKLQFLKSKGVGGFTFVELIVVVAIIVLMSGSGLVAFLDLRDRRAILSDAKLVEQTLRSAQRLALAGNKPIACGNNALTGYQVRVGTTAVYTKGVCVGGAATETEVLMASSVLDAEPDTVVFGVLHGGATATTIDICELNGDYHYQIIVTAGGVIEQPMKSETPCVIVTPTPSPTQGPLGSPTPTLTSTPSPTLTYSPTPTQSQFNTPTPTFTPTPTQIESCTPSNKCPVGQLLCCIGYSCRCK